MAQRRSFRLEVRDSRLPVRRQPSGSFSGRAHRRELHPRHRLEGVRIRPHSPDLEIHTLRGDHFQQRNHAPGIRRFGPGGDGERRFRPAGPTLLHRVQPLPDLRHESPRLARFRRPEVLSVNAARGDQAEEAPVPPSHAYCIAHPAGGGKRCRIVWRPGFTSRTVAPSARPGKGSSERCSPRPRRRGGCASTRRS